MFSIGFFEILLIAILGLLVFGPEKLPDAIRTFVTGFSKMKRALNNTKRELEQELGMDEIRQEIRNAEVMEKLESIKKTSSPSLSELADKIEESAQLSMDASTPIDASSSGNEEAIADSSDSTETAETLDTISEPGQKSTKENAPKDK